MSDEDVERLIAMRGTITTRAAGELFGIDHCHVSQIWNGKRRAGKAL
jgi:hypothetical protein